jgi:hypothetical protein
VRPRGLVFGGLPQSQLSERGEIPFAEEVVEGLFNLLDTVDFALPQTGTQRVDGDIY